VKYQSAIDNKRADGATVKMKEGVWHTLAAEFQATSINQSWWRIHSGINDLRKILLNHLIGIGLDQCCLIVP
jgi:hypothetical protein